MNPTSFRKPFAFALCLGALACSDAPPVEPALAAATLEEAEAIVETTGIGTIPGTADVLPDGNFSYSIPVVVPPGRSGMQPQLSIGYSSGAGESALGVGFSLRGLSAISRCPRTFARDDERRAVDLTDDDRLCLDGDRLVAEPGLTYGAAGTGYRPSTDALRRVTETSRNGDGVTGPVGFRVELPNGHIRTYGGTANARVEVPRATDRVAETWLLSEEVDALGNVVLYHYEHVLPTGHKLGEDIVVGDLVRISSIDYTGWRTSVALYPGTRHVDFIYAEQPRRASVGTPYEGNLDPGAATSGGLLESASPSDGFRHGVLWWPASVFPLETIRTRVDDKIVHEYRLSGSDDTVSHRYRLNQIELCTNAPAEAPEDLDPSGLVCLPPTTFDWRQRAVTDPRPDPRYGESTFEPWYVPFARWVERFHYACGQNLDATPMTCHDANPVAALDANGDGADDLFYRAYTPPGVPAGPFRISWGQPGTRALSRSLTTAIVPFQTHTPVTIRTGDVGWFALSPFAPDFQVIDWNTDGFDDLVAFTDDPEDDANLLRLAVLLSDGTGGFDLLETDTTLVRPNSDHPGPWTIGTEFLDLNGDGRKDLATCQLTYPYVRTPFGRWPSRVSPADGADLRGYRGHWAYALREREGFGELVAVEGETDCQFEYGRAYVSNFNFENDVNDLPSYPRQPVTADFDGNGTQELLIAEEYTLPRTAAFHRVLRWDSTLGAATIETTNVPGAGWTTVDVNGDGNQDLVASHRMDTASDGWWGCDEASFSDRTHTCPMRAISVGNVADFMVDYIESYMPLRRRVRNSFTHSQPNRSPLSLIGFDINGDGRGDLLAPTLPRDNTMIYCDAAREDCNDGWDSGWQRWPEEDVWVIESLSSADRVEYPTSAVLEGTRSGSVYTWRSPRTIPLDGDGDGALDLVQYIVHDNSDVPSAIHIPPLTFFHNVRTEPAVLTVVTDGLGSAIEVQYGNLSDPAVYTAAHTCEYPQRCVTDARLVVAGLRTDGIVAPRERRYQYEDGRTDLSGGGWIGFAHVSSFDGSSGAHVDAWYDVETRDTSTGTYPGARAPYRVQVWREDPGTWPGGTGSVVLEGTVSTYDRAVLHPIPGVTTVVTAESKEERYESMFVPPAGAADPFVGLTPIRTSVVTRSDFDGFGFAGLETSTIGDATTIVDTDRINRISPTQWQIGLVTRRATNATAGGHLACDRYTVESHGYYSTGQLELTRLNPGTPAEVGTRYAYWPYGGIRTATEVADGETRTTNVTWPGDGYFPRTITNALNHNTQLYYEPTRGLLYETVDPNGVSSTQQYDGFARPRIASAAGGGSVETRYLRPSQPDAAFEVETTSQPGGRTVELHDRLGRPFARERDLALHRVSTEIEYDSRGRIHSASEPHAVGTSPTALTVFTYDGLDRIRHVQSPVPGREMTMWYEPRRTYTQNSVGHVWTRVEDERGNLAALHVPGVMIADTTHSYCGAGDLRQTVDSSGNVTTIDYNLLGQRVGLHDPDAGDSTFHYDSRGQLRRIVDAESRVTRLDYDLLGRPQYRRRDADGVVDEWAWDTATLPSGQPALGLLHQATSGDGVIDETVYDEYARAVQWIRQVDGQTLITESKLDDFGRVGQVTYPMLAGSGNPLTVSYRYEGAGGQLTSIVNGDDDSEMFWSLEDESDHGAPTLEKIGPIERVTQYSDVGEIIGIDSGAASALQSLTYQYDDRGLLEWRHDNLAGAVERLIHDQLGRITEIRNGAATSEHYDYDGTGNLLNTHDSSLGYPGHGGARPHAATSIEYKGGHTETIDYNNAGEAILIGSMQLEHSQLGLPRHVTSPDAELMYAYDTAGQRARKHTTDATTLYAGAWERHATNTGMVERVAIGTPAGVVAQVERIQELASDVRQVRWLLTDRQGSIETSWVENETPEHHRYDAFGGVLDSSGEVSGEAPASQVTHGYTGHEHDEDLGIINMRGRWYHPLLRRFLSPDPLSGGDSQRMNRYSYVQNSPYALTDLSGWGEEDEVGPVASPDEVCNPPSCINVYWEDPEPEDGASATGDGGTSERPGAVASGLAGASPDRASALGDPTRAPSNQQISDRRETAEVLAAGGGFLRGLGTEVGGTVVASIVGGALLMSGVGIPLALYVGYQTLNGAGGAYDDFLETFEKASVPDAPLEYHAAAGSALGGFVGIFWSGPLLEVGFGLGASVSPVLRTAVAASRGGSGMGYAVEVLEGGSGRAFAGHGEYRFGSGTTTIPDGTTLTTWTTHGNAIPDGMGRLIEAGDYAAIAANPRYAAVSEGAISWLPGAEIPNYTLRAPNGLRVMRNSTTVESATSLSTLLAPGSGHLDWAACLSCR